jgi:hypothetical protein
VLALLAGTAFANGDNYFRFNVFADKPLDQQVIFAGTVKDEDGRRIKDARLTIGIVIPVEVGEKLVTYNAYTNDLGRYRSLDVASVVLALEELEVSVDASKVTLRIDKTGHEEVRRISRARGGQKNGIFEVDFTLKKTH